MKKLFSILLVSAFVFTAQSQALREVRIGTTKHKVTVKNTLEVDSNLIAKTNITLKTVTATLNFPATDSLASSDLTIAWTGAAVGDVVLVSPGLAAISAKTSYTAWVSATDVITVRFNNYSFATINPASASFKVKLIK